MATVTLMCGLHPSTWMSASFFRHSVPCDAPVTQHNSQRWPFAAGRSHFRRNLNVFQAFLWQVKVPHSIQRYWAGHQCKAWPLSLILALKIDSHIKRAILSILFVICGIMQAVKWVKNAKLRNYWDLVEIICSWWNYLFFPLGKCVIHSNCGTLSTASGGARLTSLVEFFGTAGRNGPGAEHGWIIRTGYWTCFFSGHSKYCSKNPMRPKKYFSRCKKIHL